MAKTALPIKKSVPTGKKYLLHQLHLPVIGCKDLRTNYSSLRVAQQFSPPVSISTLAKVPVIRCAGQC